MNKYSEELVEDHIYASSLDELITCPFCGVVHLNELTEKSELIKDVQTASNILTSTATDLKELQRELTLYQKRFVEIESSYKKNEKGIEIA